MKIKQIEKAVKLIPSKFSENELAYLSITSKNEGLIRDTLTRILIKDPTNIVIRECHRSDLVLYKHCKNANIDFLDSVYELKSMYNFDFYQSKKEYLKVIYEDIKKINSNPIYNSKDKFIIIISVDPQNTVSKNYNNYVNYIKNRARPHHFKSVQSINQTKANLFREFNNKFSKDFLIRRISIDAGVALGVHVIIHFWIMKQKADVTYDFKDINANFLFTENID